MLGADDGDGAAGELEDAGSPGARDAMLASAAALKNGDDERDQPEPRGGERDASGAEERGGIGGFGDFHAGGGIYIVAVVNGGSAGRARFWLVNRYCTLTSTDGELDAAFAESPE